MKKIMMTAASLMLAIAAFAQQAQPLPVDPALKVGRLDNGLTYYIRHNEEPKGQANFYIAQKVGSVLEEEEQRGLAHFLEHMCFNGTEHFPGNGVIKYCESIGVKFGENLNAYTSIDETVYNIDNVPVGVTPSALDSCLWILHDWADGLLLTAEDIDHERGVIHEEWRSRMNSASLRLIEKTLPEIYPGNRYGERMPIGLMSVVDNFPYEALRSYYEKWYRPDLQGVVVVGDIDVAEVEAKIRDIFGTIAAPVDPAERVYFQIEDNAETIVSMNTDKEQPYAMTYVFCKHDKYPVEYKNDINYLVYKYALTAASVMMESRIQEIMEKPDSPFLQAGVQDDDYLIACTKGAWTGTAISSAEQFCKAVSVIYREMLRATRCGFTASEYDRARAEILSSYETAFNQRDKKKSSSYCSEYVRHFISNEPVMGIENAYAIMQQVAPAIPVEMVNQVVSSLVGEGNLVVSCMLPEKDGVSYPSVDEMKALLAAIAAEDIQPYEDKVSDEPLVGELPAPGRVVKSSDSIYGYRRHVLSNGATVYIKSTDFNADQIIMKAFSKGGTSIYPEKERVQLVSVAELMTAGGVGNFSRTELAKALSGKKVGVAPFVGIFSEEVNGSSTVRDFETMLQLNYLYFTSLRKDEDAFNTWKAQTRSVIANRAIQPMSAFQDSLSVTIYRSPVRIAPLTLEEIDKVDYDRTLSIAAERFSNAADFSFIFTGAIDEQTALPLIEKYIGSLPSSRKREKPDGKALRFRKGNVENVFDKEMEIPMATNGFFNFAKGSTSLKDRLSYQVALNALSTRLLEEIREKEGGTYGIGADGSMDAYPVKEAYFQIAYQCDPARYEYLNGRVREIVDEFAENGPSEEDLNKAKEFFMKSYREGLRENKVWSSSFVEYLQSGITDLDGYEAALESVDVESARKVFAKVLKEGNHAEVIMRGTAKE